MTVVDAIAKRYGVTPGDVVRMSPEDFGFALVCLQASRESLVDAARDADSMGGLAGAVYGLVVMHAGMVS